MLKLQVSLYGMVCLLIVGCAQTNSIKKLLSHNEKVDSEFDRITAIARLTERHGDLEQAKQLYERALDDEKTRPTAYHRLGVIAAKQGDLTGALDLFDKARIDGQDAVDLEVDWAYALLLNGDADEAEERFQKALELDPVNKRALNNLAILHGTQGRFEDSLACSAKAVGSAKAHANIGYLLSQFGDVEQAASCYHIALSKDPALKIAANALLQLEQTPPSPSTSPLPLPSTSVLARDSSSADADDPASGVETVRIVAYEGSAADECGEDTGPCENLDSTFLVATPMPLPDMSSVPLQAAEQEPVEVNEVSGEPTAMSATRDAEVVQDFVKLDHRRNSKWNRNVHKAALPVPLQIEPHGFSLQRLPSE